MEQKKREAYTLLRILAQGAPEKTRALLQKYGTLPANNYKELEAQLADLFIKVPDKITLQKEMVSIHPHRDFIMTYEKPAVKENPEPIEAIEPLEVQTDTKKDQAGVEMSKGTEIKLNCDGCNGGCGKSSAAGFPMPDKPQAIDNSDLHLNVRIAIIASASVLTLGLLLHYKKI